MPKNTDKGVKHDHKGAQQQEQQKPQLTMTALADENITGEFDSKAFELLSQNENVRYKKRKKLGSRVAHAIIKTNEEGEKIALQYELPQLKSTNPEVPVMVELSNIEEITRYGLVRHRAIGPDGKRFYATRYSHARVKMNKDSETESVDIAYFSEEEGKEPFWGSKNTIPRFKEDLDKEEQKEQEEIRLSLTKSNKKKSAESQDEEYFSEDEKKIAKQDAHEDVIKKGGRILELNAESVKYRDLNRKRSPDQNTVMGGSACNAYKDYYEEKDDILHEKIKPILARAFNANISQYPENIYRPEWLHREGYSLMPTHINPQVKSNLGAAGKWANTEMMVLERAAKWMALNTLAQKKLDKISIKSEFEMLQDSELIDRIKFQVNFEGNGRKFRFVQNLDPFMQCPVERKASDVAQATGLVHSIIQGKKWIKEEKIIGASIQEPKPAKRDAMPVAQFQPSVRSVPPAFAGLKSPIGEHNMTKKSFPTSIKNENSVVQVLTSSFEPDYEEPCANPRVFHSSGSGFVIERKGVKYVVTNAHCVENLIRTKVRLANSRKTFGVKPICISYQCDLALLEVPSSKFQKLVEPLEIGEMVANGDEVSTIGFPIGGDEISVTKGIVSRIQVQGYAMSNQDMLTVQVDAAINPGNSGGPVLSQGKLIGVAFQGIALAQNLGYIIPMPIVNHFINEAFSGKEYRGFPVLPVAFKSLINRIERKFYGMKKDQTGILIQRIDPLTDAAEKLKEGDVLLEIDGLTVSNEGTVNIANVGQCINILHVQQMKYIGDEVHLKILRSGKELDVTVTMDTIPLDNKVVPPIEHDKTPTYYSNSGFIFVPLTRNYLECTDLSEMSMITEAGVFSLETLPKTRADEQLVVIHDVLDCKTTEGYDDAIHELVKTINGVPINNFKDVIRVMESNEQAEHLIVTRSNQKIILKNLNDEENRAVLARHHIHFDRSKDLRGEEIGATLHEEVTDTSDDEEEAITKMVIPSRQVEPMSEDEEPILKAKSRKRVRQVESPDEDYQPSKKTVLPPFLSKNSITPGQLHLQKAVLNLEQQYQENEEEDEEEEDILDFDHLTENAETSDEEEDYEPQPRRSNRNHKSSSHYSKEGHSMFAQKNKLLGKRDVDELHQDGVKKVNPTHFFSAPKRFKTEEMLPAVKHQIPKI